MTPLCTTLLTDIQSAGVAYTSVGALLILMATLLSVWALARYKDDAMQFGILLVAAILSTLGMCLALVNVGDVAGPASAPSFLRQCGDME